MVPGANLPTMAATLEVLRSLALLATAGAEQLNAQGARETETALAEALSRQPLHHVPHRRMVPTAHRGASAPFACSVHRDLRH